MNTAQKQKSLTCIVAMIVMAFLLPSPAAAFQGHFGSAGRREHGRMSPFGIWHNAELCKELGLNASQVDGLKNADFTYQEKTLQLRAQLDALKLQMEKSFSAVKVDEVAVRKTAQSISEIKSKLYLHRIDARLELMKILNAEQLDNLRSRRMKSMTGHGGGFGKGDACPLKKR